MEAIRVTTLLVTKPMPWDKRAKRRGTRRIMARHVQRQCDEIDRILEPLACCTIREHSKDGVIVVAVGYACDEAAAEAALDKLGYRIVDHSKITTHLPLTVRLLSATTP